MHPQKWDSGAMCELGKHFDTFMYAFVNPFSRWKITPVPFSNSVCQSRTTGSQTNPGCNIDNTDGNECGKVVNMMVFKAERDGEEMTICGLNTHMSFAGTASQRMSYIATAMAQTDAANCDSVFFLGDFNSRLHCEEGSHKDLPPFDRRNQPDQSSLDYILDKFCSVDDGENKCDLKDSPLDELNQILGKEELQCYEKFSKPKPNSMFGKIDYWDIVPVPNPVKGTGLQEVLPVTFPPTYKLMHPYKAAKIEAKAKDKLWKRCLEGEKMCFVNEDRKGKHNPAWTDRILMKSSKNVRLETTHYSRRPVASVASDHTAVAAKVKVSIA